MIVIRLTPNTANTINNVSHNPAAIITGIVLINCFWFAPWLNTNTFCAPKGKIKPKAKTNHESLVATYYLLFLQN